MSRIPSGWEPKVTRREMVLVTTETHRNNRRRKRILLLAMLTVLLLLLLFGVSGVLGAVNPQPPAATWRYGVGRLYLGQYARIVANGTEVAAMPQVVASGTATNYSGCWQDQAVQADGFVFCVRITPMATIVDGFIPGSIPALVVAPPLGGHPLVSFNQGPLRTVREIAITPAGGEKVITLSFPAIPQGTAQYPPFPPQMQRLISNPLGMSPVPVPSKAKSWCDAAGQGHGYTICTETGGKVFALSLPIP